MSPTLITVIKDLLKQSNLSVKTPEILPEDPCDPKETTN
jgi:hypothetical protein